MLTALACLPGADEDGSSSSHRAVLLVSLDGLQFEYLDSAQTPTIDRLISEGSRAQSLVPPFPSKTFPSHWSQVTGLHPEHHGIVDNTVYDPDRDAWFSMTDDDATSDPRWWGGEPVWLSAERQGLRAATLFWPGSEAWPASTRVAYNGSLPWDSRREIVLDWLSGAEPPHFVTLYIAEPDGTGHTFGPDHPELVREVESVDAWLGTVVDGIEERGLEVDLVVVSDHGMTGISSDRMVFLDDAIDPYAHQIVTWTPVTNLFTTEDPAEVVEALSALEHVACSRKEDLEERLHFSESDRIGDVVCVAEEGWSISSRGFWASHRDIYDGGTHGYDPALPSTQGILVARGPSFAEGVEVPSVQGVDVYELLCAALGIEPAPNDGDFAAVEAMLR